MDIILTPEEARVLGSLLEKEMATPEYYPLTLNALLNACNQKTNRVPVVSYDDKMVLAAIKELQNKRLVWQSSLGRVAKYEQSFTRNHKLINSEAAVLCMLMLRGPQTAGEIRTHTERLYDFKDQNKLDQTLSELTDAGYAVKIPRQPGQKESRYAHLFSGHPEAASMETPVCSAQEGIVRETDGRLAALQDELNALRRDFEELKVRVGAFMEQFK